MLGSGGAAAIAPDGQLAHIVQNYDGCRCDVLLVRPSLLGPDRVVYRDPHPGEILGDAWSVENQLAAMVGTSSANGSVTHNEIVLYPGTARRQIIQPGAMLDLQSGIWFGPHGELACRP